jgi:hydroxymethylglutaryl-CoA lyase
MEVEILLREMLRTIPVDCLAGHFHDTYGQAVANVVKAYSLGIKTFDSSLAGLGGCPFAKGAKGNLSTEDLLYTLEKMGVETGVDLNEVVATGVWISQQLRIPNGSRAGAALASKLQTTSPFTSTPTRSTRAWDLLQSTQEYRIYRSGVNVNIRLTRPQNGNALTLNMMKSLTQLFNSFSVDDTIFRILVSAEGKYFCTGMDLKGPGTSKQRFHHLTKLFESIDTCPKTTIAAINGPCLGGGVGLAFVCDLRIATTKASFRLTEVRLGLCPATISKYVIREWGFSLARMAMLTAKQIKPEDLAALQILHKVVADQGALDNEIDTLLDTMRYVAPHASALSKSLMTSAWIDAGRTEQDRVIERSFEKMMAEGSESTEGIKRFQKGVKEVDWESLLRESSRPKL